VQNPLVEVIAARRRALGQGHAGGTGRGGRVHRTASGSLFETELGAGMGFTGVQRAPGNHFVFFASIGDAHVIGAPLELVSVDCLESTNACANASHDFAQMRLGFGGSF
jgi:hypothetical protein